MLGISISNAAISIVFPDTECARSRSRYPHDRQCNMIATTHLYMSNYNGSGFNMSMSFLHNLSTDLTKDL